MKCTKSLTSSLPLEARGWNIRRAWRWFLPGIALAAAILLMMGPCAALAQRPGVNYDESKVPSYTLPNPLVVANGQRVTSARMWMEKRRPELLKLFETYEYGFSPGRPAEMTFHVASVDQKALGGKAVRKEVVINFFGKKDGHTMRLLIYLPKNTRRPVPMFLGLNFGGNQTVASDPGITVNPGRNVSGWEGRVTGLSPVGNR